MKKIFFVLISLFPLVFVSADNNPEAEKIVKKVVSNLKKSAYQCSFSVIYQDENNKATQNKSGVLQLNNKEFRLVIDDVETKYDGKTQWVYSAENNEVIKTKPTPKIISVGNKKVEKEDIPFEVVEKETKDLEIGEIFARETYDKKK